MEFREVISDPIVIRYMEGWNEHPTTTSKSVRIMK